MLNPPWFALDAVIPGLAHHLCPFARQQVKLSRQPPGTATNLFRPRIARSSGILKTAP